MRSNVRFALLAPLIGVILALVALSGNRIRLDPIDLATIR